MREGIGKADVKLGRLEERLGISPQTSFLAIARRPPGHHRQKAHPLKAVVRDNVIGGVLHARRYHHLTT